MASLQSWLILSIVVPVVAVVLLSTRRRCAFLCFHLVAWWVLFSVVTSCRCLDHLLLPQNSRTMSWVPRVLSSKDVLLWSNSLLSFVMDLVEGCMSELSLLMSLLLLLALLFSLVAFLSISSMSVAVVVPFLFPLLLSVLARLMALLLLLAWTMFLLSKLNLGWVCSVASCLSVESHPPWWSLSFLVVWWLSSCNPQVVRCLLDIHCCRVWTMLCVGACGCARCILAHFLSKCRFLQCWDWILLLLLLVQWSLTWWLLLSFLFLLDSQLGDVCWAFWSF